MPNATARMVAKKAIRLSVVGDWQVKGSQCFNNVSTTLNLLDGDYETESAMRRRYATCISRQMQLAGQAKLCRNCSQQQDTKLRLDCLRFKGRCKCAPRLLYQNTICVEYLCTQSPNCRKARGLQSQSPVCRRRGYTYM